VTTAGDSCGVCPGASPCCGRPNGSSSSRSSWLVVLPAEALLAVEAEEVHAEGVEAVTKTADHHRGMANAAGQAGVAARPPTRMLSFE